MVEEQYVSDETSKMLKEAGFKANCAFIRDDNQERLYCPTQALAARWLREVHGIMIVSFFDDYMGKWYYVIDGVKKQSGIKCVQSASDYDDYEEAIEAGLKHSLELIKK